MASIEDSIAIPGPIAMSAEDCGGIARRARLSVWAKAIYGSGEMVNGITATGLTYLAFFYLTAVCGLSGTRAGMITFITLLVDSVADPLVGLLSDNTRSRLGRRHPYMLGSIVPIAIAFAMVFSIPAAFTGLRLFCYVVLLMLVLRVGLSFFYLPYLAIGAEVSDDYYERSSIVGYRLFCSAISAFACLYLGLGGLSANPAALLERSNYLRFGWIAGAGLIVIGLGATLGTIPQIPRLHRAHRRPGRPLVHFIRELREIFQNRSFVSLFLCCLLFFVAQGTAAVLAIDANRYFWNLSASINQAVLLTLVLAPVIGMPIARLLQNHTEKRTLAIGGALVFAVCQFYPPLMRIYGLLPNDFRYLGELLVANAALSAVGLVVSAISFQSMMADAADHHEYLFGVRREAMFLSGVTFSVKSASGLGSLIAGVALDAIHFPADIARRGLEPHLALGTVHGLGWIAGPLPAIITALSVLPLLIYSLDQEKYRMIHQALRERRNVTAAEDTHR